MIKGFLKYSLSFIAIVTFVSSQIVSFVSPNVYASANFYNDTYSSYSGYRGYGYFTGVKPGHAYSGLNGFVINKGICNGGSCNVTRFIDEITKCVDRNSTCRDDARYFGENKRGAIFIVYSMLGRNGSTSMYSGSNALTSSHPDFIRWKNLVQSYSDKGLVDFNTRSSASRDTISNYGFSPGGSYSATTSDITWSPWQEYEKPSIVFYNPNGTIAYQLFKYCANPFGNFSGMPEIDKPEMSVTKTASTSSPVKGDDFEYTITVKNTGNTQLNNVAINDTVPSNLQIVQIVQGNGSLSNNNRTYNHTVNIAAGASHVVKLKVRASSAGSTKNEACAEGGGASKACGEVTVDVKNPSLLITKSVSPGKVSLGTDFTFTIKVTNNGQVTLNNIEVEDHAPANITFESTSAGTIDGNKRKLTETISLGAGSSKTYTVGARASVVGTYTNTASFRQTQYNLTGSANATIVVGEPPNNFTVNAYSQAKISDSSGPVNNSSWTNSGTVLTARPGQFIFFKHEIRQNNGTTGNINYNWTTKTTGSFEWGNRDTQNASGTTAGNPGQIVMRKGRVSGLPNMMGANEGYSYYKDASTGGIRGVSYEDIGKTICQNMTYTLNSTDGATKISATTSQVCVKVEAWPWQLTPETRVKSSSTNTSYVTGTIRARVGETLDWQHTINNKSSYNAPGYGGIVKGGSSSHFAGYGVAGYEVSFPGVDQWAWVRDRGGPNMPDIAANSYHRYEASKPQSQVLSWYQITPPTSRTVTSSNVGQTFCQRAYVVRTTSGGSEGRAPYACAYVPFIYELQPCMSGGAGSDCGGVDIPQERGTTVTATPKVRKPSGTNTKNTQWKVTSWTVPAARETTLTPSSHIDNTNSDPCAVYNGAFGVTQAQSGCTVAHNGNQNFNAADTTLSSAITNFTVPSNADIGSRFCFALSVNPYSFAFGESEATQNAKANSWRHGAPLCILVVKKPKMQVWGGGVYSGDKITTSQSSVGSVLFGSWVEYEAISGGKITGFRSEASNNTNRLTLANDVSSDLGGYGAWSSRGINDTIGAIQARYPWTIVSTANHCSVNGTTRVKTCATSANQTPSALAYADNADTIVIVSEKNAFIHGNIIKPSVMGPTGKPRQTIIIADNVYIHQNVTRVDAWIIAKNAVYTCATGNSASMTASTAIANQNTCGNKLEINGPVMAGRLNQYRTFGGDDIMMSNETPAETYRFRADTYLWAADQAKRDGGIMTTYTKELPVRF